MSFKLNSNEKVGEEASRAIVSFTQIDDRNHFIGFMKARCARLRKSAGPAYLFLKYATACNAKIARALWKTFLHCMKISSFHF
ncbi:MAG TPA: hypothetical protein VIG66_05595 [Noviherbaspirillum sp.]